MFHIIKEVRDINRLREILTILFEEWFDFLIETKLRYKIPFGKRLKKKFQGRNCPPWVWPDN